MKTINLGEWTITASSAYQADFSKDITEGVLMPWLTTPVKATVPGSIYRDLLAAGKIEEPYYGENSLNCEWVKDRWWAYRTTFTLTASELSKNLEVCFDGIDYSAQIYLNGVKLGHHEGMYIPFRSNINAAAKEGENILVCVLEHAPLADPQPGYTSKTRYLKARYNYKWDFAVRLVNVGLYGDVTVTAYDEAAVRSDYVRTLKQPDNSFDVEYSIETEAFCDCTATLKISGTISSDNQAEDTPLLVSQELVLSKGINNSVVRFNAGFPKLWWPNGYGEQALHNITAELIVNGKTIDSVSHAVGFKTIEYTYADGREDALPYLVKINGKPIYLKGTNIVPSDCMMGYGIEQEESLISAAKEANINYFRIWGGGHIESESFYSLCDKYGIMILQELTMSSSGCDDVPSRNKEFLELLFTAIDCQFKLKRNHVSLILADGGNELSDWRFMDSDDHEGHPATMEDETLIQISQRLKSVAPDLMFFPSSGSGPRALLDIEDKGKNHDVHGPWGYQGPYNHYSFYNKSDSIVHGEFGCGGMTNLETIKKYIPKKDQKLYTSAENSVWMHHSVGWDVYTRRELTMFGDLKKIPFKDYIKVSQLVQYESLRYSLEANRRRQWKSVGEMTWQFNEPWPNIQCSNVYNYDGSKKLGYYALQDAYKPVLISLEYDRFFFAPGDSFRSSIYIINDKADSSAEISYKVVDEKGKLLASGNETLVAKEDVCQKVCDITLDLPSNITGSFSVIIDSVVNGEKTSKEYSLLIADRDIKITIPSLDKYFMKKYNHGNTIEEIETQKRADYKSVVKYFDRLIKNYE